MTSGWTSFPQGEMLVLENRDVPGIIGSVGTLLGQHKINIAAMNLGPRGRRGRRADGDQHRPEGLERPCSRSWQALPSVLVARHIVI